MTLDGGIGRGVRASWFFRVDPRAVMDPDEWRMTVCWDPREMERMGEGEMSQIALGDGLPCGEMTTLDMTAFWNSAFECVSN